MGKLLSIARNTFVETLRQPIYGVIVATALLLFLLSPSVTMYTMDDDNKLLREIGLSTLFLTSLFVAIFSASGAINQEAENKTLSMVLSKPVRRHTFILAKYLGVAGAVAMAHWICTVALLMAIRNGVPETVNDTVDPTVITAAGALILITLALGAFFNYFFDWRFSSTAMGILAVTAAAAMAFLAVMDREWKFNPASNKIAQADVHASILLLLAALVMAAMALALSTRFNLLVTLLVCVGVFLLGLVSDYVFGTMAGDYWWGPVGRFVTPNLQVFWVSDAIYEGSPVPARYVGMVAGYAACYAGAILAIAVGLFQRRQVG